MSETLVGFDKSYQQCVTSVPMEKCSFDYRLAQRCADQEVCMGDRATTAINKIDRIDVHLHKTVLKQRKVFKSGRSQHDQHHNSQAECAFVDECS